MKLRKCGIRRIVLQVLIFFIMVMSLISVLRFRVLVLLGNILVGYLFYQRKFRVVVVLIRVSFLVVLLVSIFRKVSVIVFVLIFSLLKFVSMFIRFVEFIMYRSVIMGQIILRLRGNLNMLMYWGMLKNIIGEVIIRDRVILWDCFKVVRLLIIFIILNRRKMRLIFGLIKDDIVLIDMSSVNLFILGILGLVSLCIFFLIIFVFFMSLVMQGVSIVERVKVIRGVVVFIIDIVFCWNL